MTALKVPVYSITRGKSNLKYNLTKFMMKNNIDTLGDLLLKSTKDVEWYWNAVNEDLGIRWMKPYEKVLDCSNGLAWCNWFVSGKCNIVDNAIQKNIEKNPLKTAFIFVNNSGMVKKISYKELDLKIDIFAYFLKSIGVKKGDVVSIYLPMTLDSFVATYACSKLGAINVPIFSGFGKKALEQRLIDSHSSYLITRNSFQRRCKLINLKEYWSEVFSNTLVKKIVTVENDTIDIDGGNIISFKNYLKDFVHEFNNIKKFKPEIMDSKDPLFILYTSGTTGKPKGTVQTHGGFTVFAAQQSSYLIDLTPTDILFWYADVGWITGQTWVVYGCPIIGSTAVIFEDVLDYPDAYYWAKFIDELKVTIFGAAPTVIRQFIKNNLDLSKFEFKYLRLLVSTGERLNKEAWTWYYNNIGKNRCPIINLSGGTEIGGAILSMLPFLDNTPTSVGVPVPGFDVDILNDDGCSVDNGYLVIKKPWPAMTRGLLNDDKRYLQTYWSKFPDVWYHGDRVQVDEQKMWYIIGRIDDVIKIAGHRIDPGEIEGVITENPNVIEAAAVGIPDDITGESMAIFCVLKHYEKSDIDVAISIKKDLKILLEGRLGKFVLPSKIYFVNDLPKNRSGKILRRLIREKLLGNTIASNDLLIIENPESLGNIHHI